MWAKKYTKHFKVIYLPVARDALVVQTANAPQKTIKTEPINVSMMAAGENR